MTEDRPAATAAPGLPSGWRPPLRKSPHDATVKAVGGALGWSVISRLIQFGLSLAGSIVVVHGLGPDRYGMLTVLKTALAFVTAICGLGLGQAALRYLPSARANLDAPLARFIINRVLAWQLVAWLAAMAIVWIGRGLVARVAFPLMADYFVLGTALVVAELAFLTTNFFTTAFYDSRSLSLVTLGGAGLYLALAVLALRLGYGVPGVMVATAVAYLAMSMALAARALRHVRQIESPPAAAAATAGPGLDNRMLLRYSLPFAIIGILNLIVWRQSETLLLAHFRTMRESGFWDLAYRMPQMLLEFVPGAIWPLLMAGFSEIYTRDRDKLIRAITVYYKLLFLLVAPISIIGAAVGDRAFVAFYGEEMSPAGVYCQVLFLVFAASYLATPLSMAFFVLEKPWWNLAQSVVNAVVLIGLDLLLIPRFGLTGALIPMAVVILASPAINLRLLARLGVRPRIPWGFLGRIYLAAVPCVLLYPARLVVHGKVPLAVAALVAALLYVVCLRLFRVLGQDEEELLLRSKLPFAPRLLALLTGRSRHQS